MSTPESSPSVAGERLSLPGNADVPIAARAYIPFRRLQDFESEPAIEWRGSLSVAAVREMVEMSFKYAPEAQCRCEIWADDATPEPRTFNGETAAEIVDYLGAWSSRANVSLSILPASNVFPVIYVWGTLRDGKGTESTDEVGVSLDRRLMGSGGAYLVHALFDLCQGQAAPSPMFHRFASDFEKRALA